VAAASGLGCDLLQPASNNPSPANSSRYFVLNMNAGPFVGSLNHNAGASAFDSLACAYASIAPARAGTPAPTLVKIQYRDVTWTTGQKNYFLPGCDSPLTEKTE